MTYMFTLLFAVSVVTSGCDLIPGLRKATGSGQNADGAVPSSRPPAQGGGGSDAADGPGKASGGGGSDAAVGPGTATGGGSEVSPSTGAGGQGPTSGWQVGVVDAGTSAANVTLASYSDGGSSLWLVSGDASVAGFSNPNGLPSVTFPSGQVISWPTADSGLPTPLASSTSRPAAAAAGATSLALATDATGPSPSRLGCGEPQSCFLRASISTASGRKYAASFSTAYPEDTCARDLVGKDKNTILVGDSYPRTAAGGNCSATYPQMTLAFFLPPAVVGKGFIYSDFWLGDDGFKSQWRLTGASGADSGDYVPAPGMLSRLDLWWVAAVSGSEAYGQLSVPLQHTVSGAPALGFVAFDVRIR